MLNWRIPARMPLTYAFTSRKVDRIKGALVRYAFVVSKDLPRERKYPLRAVMLYSMQYRHHYDLIGYFV